MYFSKSKYTNFWQCPKITWLDKYKPEEKEVDEGALGRMANGNVVGDLAMNLFGDFTEVTAYSADGKLDLDEMKRKTSECIDKDIEYLPPNFSTVTGFVKLSAPSSLVEANQISFYNRSFERLCSIRCCLPYSDEYSTFASLGFNFFIRYVAFPKRVNVIASIPF